MVGFRFSHNFNPSVTDLINVGCAIHKLAPVSTNEMALPVSGI